MATRARAATAPRVALACDDERTGADVARAAAERGIPVERVGVEAAMDAPVGAIAYAPAMPPDPARAASMARLVEAAAQNRRPIVMFVGFERARGKAAEERACAIAFLRAHGAIPIEDPDVWFEAAILMAGFGAPPGPRVAVVAPPGGWLALQATAYALEEEARGGSRLPVTAEGQEAATDIVLVDGGLETPDHIGPALVVPVVARGELLPADGRTVLVGLRAAVAAAMAAGRHAERLAQGLGPAPAADAKRLKPDRARVDKALAHAADRLGDQECKLLLSAYGVPIVRQAVAQSPSAVVRYATQLGWPVEVKPWDPGATRERDGGVVVTGVRNPPDARRAFARAASDAGLQVGTPVIVRATPPPGRELAARIEKHGELGWTVFLDGGPRPLAAPAPLRRADADDLAAALEASRAGDGAPDRAALADLLVRASFAAVDCDDLIESFDLGRIVIGSRGAGALVVDARARLKRRR